MVSKPPILQVYYIHLTNLIENYSLPTDDIIALPDVLDHAVGVDGVSAKTISISGWVFYSDIHVNLLKHKDIQAQYLNGEKTAAHPVSVLLRSYHQIEEPEDADEEQSLASARKRLTVALGDLAGLPKAFGSDAFSSKGFDFLLEIIRRRKPIDKFIYYPNDLELPTEVLNCAILMVSNLSMNDESSRYMVEFLQLHLVLLNYLHEPYPEAETMNFVVSFLRNLAVCKENKHKLKHTRMVSNFLPLLIRDWHPEVLAAICSLFRVLCSEYLTVFDMFQLPPLGMRESGFGERYISYALWLFRHTEDPKLKLAISGMNARIVKTLYWETFLTVSV